MPRTHIRANNKGNSYEAETTMPNLCQGTMPLSCASSHFCSSSLPLLSYLTYSRAESSCLSSVHKAQSQSDIATPTEVVIYAHWRTWAHVSLWWLTQLSSLTVAEGGFSLHRLITTQKKVVYTMCQGPTQLAASVPCLTMAFNAYGQSTYA